MDANDRGASLLEVLAVLALAGILASLSAPLSASALDTGRIRSATAFLSARFRLARLEAVNRSANVGVVFDQVNGLWELRACRDANGNGLRRAEIGSGSDPCFDGPHRFTAMFPGVDIAVDPRLVGPAGEPGHPDPVRLGTPDIASFSPTGSCTPGSVYLRSAKGQQFAIRVSGANGRLRMFRYDPAPGTWFQF